MEFNYKLESLADLEKAAKAFINAFPDQRKFLFDAPMGAGKTTFIKAIMKELSVEDEVSSPTYSIVNEYFSVTYGKIYHFDFYRLNDEIEAYDIGTEELLESNDYCFIEWPGNIPNLLPQNYVSVSIEVDNEIRHIKAST